MNQVFSHAGRGLTAFPPFSNAAQYVRIDIRNNQISEIPATIDQFTNASMFYADHNRISDLPQEIASLKKLTRLYCRSNLLAKLPEEIGELSQLQILRISSNKFKEFPHIICEIPSLKQIDISGNLIEELPDNIANLKGLTHLQLQGNRLKFIPQSLAKLTSLAHLDLRANPDLPSVDHLQPTQVKEIIQHIIKNQKPPPPALSHNRILIYRNITNNDVNRKYRDELNKLFSELKIEFHEISDENEINENSSPIFIIAPFDISDEPELNFRILDRSKSLSRNAYVLIQDRKSVTGEHINFEKVPEINLLHEKLRQDYASETRSVSGVQAISEFIIEALRQHTPRIKLHSVRLQNIGHFADLEIPLDLEQTCIVGENGTGKTTILRAIALAIIGLDNQYVDKIKLGKMLRIHGLSGNMEAGSITLKYTLDGEEKENVVNFIPRDEGRNIKIDLAGESVLLDGPYRLKTLMVGFPQIRREAEITAIDKVKPLTSPHVEDLSPLVNNIDTNRINFFHQWIANLSNEANKQNDRDLSEEGQLIKKVFSVISKFLNYEITFMELRQVSPPSIWVKTFDAPEGIPLEITSHGFQIIIGWIGYFLHRLHGSFNITKDFSKEHAVVLVDEIDSSVHPTWQARLMKTLKEEFPNTQFVATTHSPLCAYGLKKEQVVELRNDEGIIYYHPQPSDNWAWSYEEILRETFGTDFKQLRRELASLEEINQEIEHLESTAPRNDEQEDELRQLYDIKRRLLESKRFVDEYEKGLASIREKLEELRVLKEHIQSSES